jgi:hypothetical protein
MVTPQAVMFEPTANLCDLASGVVEETSKTTNEDDLQQYRFIVPLDIVTSITISDQLSSNKSIDNSR